MAFLQRFISVFDRIINSKKSAMFAIQQVVNYVVGMGLAEQGTVSAIELGLLVAWNAGALLLLSAQIVYDFKFGSPSDGTTKLRRLDGVLADFIEVPDDEDEDEPTPGGGSASVAGGTLASIALLCVFTLGCVSYDPAAVSALAAQNQGREDFSAQECEDFRAAAAALTEGPETAVYGIGRATQLKKGSGRLEDQGAVCDAVVAQDVSADPDAFARVRVAFDRAWAAAAALVK